jgi:hypothetical protein
MSFVNVSTFLDKKEKKECKSCVLFSTFFVKKEKKYYKTDPISFYYYFVSLVICNYFGTLLVFYHLCRLTALSILIYGIPFCFSEIEATVALEFFFFLGAGLLWTLQQSCNIVF